MLIIDEREKIAFKLCMVKDLEKKMKTGYKSQFRNIIIKITSKPTRYKKFKSPVNVSEDSIKLESTSKSIYNYLLDMFDVFGNNAVLNAKGIFEENAFKWGKKFYKTYNNSYNAGDIKKLLIELYNGIKDMDSISLNNRQLSWTFMKPKEDCELNTRSDRYFNQMYEIKAIWLQSFIKALAPGYTGVLDIIEEDDEHIVSNITIKEG